MRRRLRLAAVALAVIASVTLIILGAFAASDRIADEAIERAPLPRTTSTPVPTAPPFVATLAATPGAELVTSFMPHPERQFAAGVVLADGRVLVVGGREDRFFGRVIAGDGFAANSIASAVIYDPRTNRWSEIEPPPLTRFGATMVLAGDGNAILWGGAGRSQTGGSVTGRLFERYDWLGGSWSSLPGPSFQDARAVFEFGGRVYAVSDNRLVRFDPELTTWQLVEEGPGGRDTLGALALADGRIVMFVEVPRTTLVALSTGGATTIQRSNAGRIEYIVVDPRAGARSAVRVIDGPPYRPLVGVLADGALLLYGGLAEDPTTWEEWFFSPDRIPVVRLFGDDTPGPTATPVSTPTPPPRPSPSTALFRFDVDTAELAPIATRVDDPDGTFRLADGQLYTILLPSLPVTVEGAERLHAALEGRSGAVVLPLDGSRVLVAGGATPTAEVITLVESMIEIPDGVTSMLGPSLAEIEAAIAAAGLDDPALRYRRLDAVIVRVN